MLLFLARLSFAAEESWPTCGDGDEITLTIEKLDVDLEAVDTYDWTFSDLFYDRGGRVLDTTGPTTTIRCPHCGYGEPRRWDFDVQLWDDDEAYLQWAYGYFNHDCPETSWTVGTGCASNRAGSAWLALLALAFRRRRA